MGIGKYGFDADAVAPKPLKVGFELWNRSEIHIQLDVKFYDLK